MTSLTYLILTYLPIYSWWFNILSICIILCIKFKIVWLFLNLIFGQLIWLCLKSSKTIWFVPLMVWRVCTVIFKTHQKIWNDFRYFICIFWSEIHGSLLYVCSSWCDFKDLSGYFLLSISLVGLCFLKSQT